MFECFPKLKEIHLHCKYQRNFFNLSCALHVDNFPAAKITMLDFSGVEDSDSYYWNDQERQQSNLVMGALKNLHTLRYDGGLSWNVPIPSLRRVHLDGYYPWSRVLNFDSFIGNLLVLACTVHAWCEKDCLTDLLERAHSLEKLVCCLKIQDKIDPFFILKNALGTVQRDLSMVSVVFIHKTSHVFSGLPELRQFGRCIERCES